ncbi:MAG: hypothetical protein A3K83_07090 [Omnitrophica WOR_2 bacterium RBG_13_44_8b]|nr:MAG: hypothetical protein A3K83_07090 [Omnitrophica WOR_2 bacterium RBG_13_44_8b]
MISPKPVKLITGFIFKNEPVLIRAEYFLKRMFGKSDYESEILAFAHTDYYEKEFGRGLSRKFISFQRLIDPRNLPSVKLSAGKIEKKLSGGANRNINIDPGYLDLAKLVLATTKDFTHRIYLDRGIFAEVTLFCEGKGFKPWQWTYPDYKTEEYIAIFNKIRSIYAEQIKTG